MEKAFFVPIDPGNVIRVRLMVDQGEIVDFVLQYETYIEGRWYPVVRYDGSHGQAHRDILDPRGHNVSKDWLENMTYKEAVAHADKDVRLNWEAYRDQFPEQFR